MSATHSSFSYDPATDVCYRTIRLKYRVGDDGSVWCRQRRLKPDRQKSGHLRIHLGWKCRRLIHHLVLESFVGSRPDGMECRHLNGNPGDNRLANLCWGTKKQNSDDRDRHGTTYRGERLWTAKLTAELVRKIRSEHVPRKVTYAFLSRKYGLNFWHVRDIIKRKVWRHA